MKDESEVIRKDLETRNPGDVYDHIEVRDVFTFHSFMAPLAIVTRNSDGAKGSIEFIHHPRFYFNFIANSYGDETDE